MERTDSAAIAESEIRSQFEAQPWAYDEYRLSHIFIAAQTMGSKTRPKTPRSESQALTLARMLKRKLDAGADFANLARTTSDDAATAPLGGALSSIFGLYLADEFVVAVRTLAVGEVSKPTRGPHGYHLIKLEEKHAATLETARVLVELHMRGEALPRSPAD
ncbi:PPIC-type PPIASE domain-containing protein [Variovorax sp. YR266]|uniref:peptidylprolyl isomerase n=1 Tax=Variovorax sp. YR266 TaxID=1884386 RepID=UPI000895E659|nr:peptidylprolyl isomerase [Variovorax sp. YR266]SDZ70414.1 PPIC-type PPIASE domain-containing protein [Variovorax sp. YR266]